MGYTHLDNGDGTGWQITVQEIRPDLSEVTLFNLYSDNCWTGAQQMLFPTVAEAKAQGELWAEQYHVYVKRPRRY